LANTGFQTKHVELEQFLQAFASREFVSVSWAFLFLLVLGFYVNPICNARAITGSGEDWMRHARQKIDCYTQDCTRWWCKLLISCSEVLL